MNGLLQHLLLTLRLNFRSKQAIIYGYVVPIFFLFALGSVFASKPPLLNDMGRLLTVTILGGACFGMPTAMVAERERGVWRRYRLLPAATGGIILSAMVARFVIILSAVVMQILLAHLTIHFTLMGHEFGPWGYGTPFPEHPLGMLGAFVFVSLAFLGLGLVIAMVSETVPAVQALGQAIFLPLIIIGGVGVRLESLPHWAQHVASFLPGIYAVQALQACQRGAGLADAHMPLNFLSLTVIGVAALISGAKMFRWDVGQKLTASARAWASIALVGWLSVGAIAEVPTWKAMLNPKTPDNAGPVAVQPVRKKNPIIPPNSRDASPEAASPATHPATEPAVAIVPPAQPAVAQAWAGVTKAQIDSIDYDDLPDDNSTNTPLAPNLNDVDDCTKKRMDSFNDALGDWAPGQVADIPQRIRNLLSIAAVADVAEDQNEAHIPYVIFMYLRGTVQKDQLAKALTWVILHDSEGTVLTNVKEIKELNIDAEVPEETVRERLRLYAKKLLFRVLDKKPAAR